MSLATRCPACSTVFRVVPDQLKVSEGWVRCGRCGEVFDASPGLFDLELAGRPARQAPAANDEAPADARRAAPATVPGRPSAAEAATQSTAAPVPPPAEHAPPPSPTAVASAPSADASAPTPEEPNHAGSGATPDAAPETTEPAAAAAADKLPGFMLRAQRAEARRRQRWPYALAAAAFALLLVGQIALHFRDLLAAAWPATKPPLQTACRLIGCTVGAPLRIDSLSVESVALRRIEDTPMHLLQLVVRNRAATDVRMPWIDLTLSDTQGRTTARRMIDARQLGAAGDRLAPQREVALQALLDLGETAVAGYTVELFYP